jgi:hypothetical protein
VYAWPAAAFECMTWNSTFAGAAQPSNSRRHEEGNPMASSKPRSQCVRGAHSVWMATASIWAVSRVPESIVHTTNSHPALASSACHAAVVLRLQMGVTTPQLDAMLVPSIPAGDNGCPVACRLQKRCQPSHLVPSSLSQSAARHQLAADVLLALACELTSCHAFSCTQAPVR